MDAQTPDVVDEAELFKFVHEEANFGTGGSDLIGERLLADLGQDDLGLASFPKVGQQKKHSGQSLFA